MRRIPLALALLCLGAGLIQAQDGPKGGTAEVVASCEIRVYVFDKTLKTVDANDFSAVLVLEDKGGQPSRTIPMTLTTPRGTEKIVTAPSGQTLPIEGTDLMAELVVVKLDLDGAPEEGGKAKPVVPSDDSRPVRPLTGPHFKAVLDKDQVPGQDCSMSVHFVIQGEKRVASDFRCGSNGAAPRGRSEPSRPQQDIRVLEQALEAHDMAKAKESAARLCKTLQDSGKDTHQTECGEICIGLKTAIEAGDRDKATRLLEKCKRMAETRLKE